MSADLSGSVLMYYACMLIIFCRGPTQSSPQGRHPCISAVDSSLISNPSWPIYPGFCAITSPIQIMHLPLFFIEMMPPVFGPTTKLQLIGENVIVIEYRVDFVTSPGILRTRYSYQIWVSDWLSPQKPIAGNTPKIQNPFLYAFWYPSLSAPFFQETPHITKELFC